MTAIFTGQKGLYFWSSLLEKYLEDTKDDRGIHSDTFSVKINAMIGLLNTRNIKEEWEEDIPLHVASIRSLKNDQAY